MAKKPPGPRRILPEEKNLWDHVTSDVRRTNIAKPTFMSELEPPEFTPPPRKKRVGTTALNDLPSNPVPSAVPELRHGTTNGMDRRTAQRLKRGKLKIDGRLDLHGYTQTTAHRALVQFLEHGHQDGKRTVLVITGKGGRGIEAPGVLRTAVPKWLNEMPLRQWVSGFSYAAPQDGGHGALYIRIKRKR